VWTKKSLDHLRSTCDKYKRALEHVFKGDQQAVLIEQVIGVFEPERERILRVIQKLAQIDVLSTVETVKFSLKRFE
jgi:hypothetical protein